MLSDIMSHSFYHCRRLVAMRRMTAVFQFKYFDSGNHSRDAVDLLHCPVLILLALDREYRTGDSRQVLVNIPGAKMRVEPDVVPAPECRVRVGVITSEPVAQVSG